MVPTNKLLDLSDKRVIVTGAGVGIGFGIAYRLAEAGASVLLTDVSQDNIDTAKSKLDQKGWKVSYALADVSKQEDITAMCQKAVEIFGGVDILVNNAGIYPMKAAMELTVDEVQKVLDVNLKSVFMASQTAARQMQAQGQGGKIINITSVDALHPSMVGLAHYDASKHGVWGMTKSMALELAGSGIAVNAVAPGGIATPGTGAKDGVIPESMRAFEQKIPMKRFGDADEIGKVVLFLASDMASYMTGSQVVADGGVLLS